MKAVLFDLDDTLYPERSFVEGGFWAVARHLSQDRGQDAQLLVDWMLGILARDGRGKVFDSLLSELDLYSERRLNLLLYVYRTHRPAIHLYPDVVPVLHHLQAQGLRVGIVTDGMASVQRRKVAALGLEALLDVVVCGDELGGHCRKPSTVPYELALDVLGIPAREAVYIGDNVAKDFAGANALGMLTIRIERPEALRPDPGLAPPGFEARWAVRDLEEALPLLTEVARG